MRPPDFWAKRSKSWPPPIAQWALTPASWLYAGIVKRHLARQAGAEIAARVISIGGVSMGGSGKTPLTRAVRQRVNAMGRVAGVLSRGYGGAARGCHVVDPRIHSAKDVGDEPLLHAQDGLALISRDRLAGAQAAIRAGADVLILDDAHQNPSLRKHLSFLVLDGPEGLGNGAVFPAGPLREPLERALARADCLVCVHGAMAPDGWQRPVLHANLAADGPAPNGPLLAFAGIAFPGRFLETLRANGADIVDLIPFPDHHPFTQSQLHRLHALARHHGARLITTQKDWVRLAPTDRADILAFGVSMHVQERDLLDHVLRQALEGPQ